VTFGGRLHYVPHTYPVIACRLLFVGRLALRAVQLGGVGGARAGAVPADAAAAYVTDAPDPFVALRRHRYGGGWGVRSPLTVGNFFCWPATNLWYYGLCAMKSKHLNVKNVGASPPLAP